MTDPNMGLDSKPPFQVPVPENRDPGNTDPEFLTEDLSGEETLEANKCVEEAIQTLPVSNGGVL